MYSGKAISTAGDINGDGLDDLMIGAPTLGYQNPDGACFVVFGRTTSFGATFSMSTMSEDSGFRLGSGNGYESDLGSSVSNVGDFDGDGFDELIVGAHNAQYGIGSAIVLFGKALPPFGKTGLGIGTSDFSAHQIGASVSTAGDVNGDGFDDLIVSGEGFFEPILSYVVFGGMSFSGDLTSLQGTNGFRVEGNAGGLVNDAGDINGDGFDDFITGSYVMFGKAAGFGVRIQTSTLDGSNGFRVDGGGLINTAGDMNGDGFDDLVIGRSDAKGDGSGSSYVVFGKASGFGSVLDLSNLEDGAGIRLDGAVAGDDSGHSVSGAGDVNGDGFDDLIIGAPGADPNGEGSGSGYVVFGRSNFGNVGLPEIKGTTGDDILKGSTHAEHFIAGDGRDNLLGRGGADVFDAGAGNDAIRIGDLRFASIDGGDGNDVLHLAGANLNFDLATLGSNIQGIESICIYGRGDNTLSLTAESLLDLSDTTNTLKVQGNSGDHIFVQDSGWIDDGSHGFYHSYIQDDAVLLVGANVTVTFV